MINASDFPQLTEAELQAILDRWNEPNRAWHTTTHLTQLLDKIAEQKETLSSEDQAFLRLLALFHDAIYEPLSPRIEEDSAALAAQVLPDYPRIAELTAAILATKNHVSQTPLERLFNTWDCAILHETSERTLDEYEAAIRFEYKAVAEDVYKRERTKFLRQASIDYANPALAKLADRVENAL